MALRFTIFVISIGLVATAEFAQEQKPLTVDELAVKNVEAKGGAEPLHALQSLRLTGKMLVNQGQLQLAFVQIKKRPDEVRTEVSLQGMRQVEAYDGKE